MFRCFNLKNHCVNKFQSSLEVFFKYVNFTISHFGHDVDITNVRLKHELIDSRSVN